jgi:hypothetical protein
MMNAVEEERIRREEMEEGRTQTEEEAARRSSMDVRDNAKTYYQHLTQILDVHLQNSKDLTPPGPELRVYL